MRSKIGQLWTGWSCPPHSWLALQMSYVCTVSVAKITSMHRGKFYIHNSHLPASLMLIRYGVNENLGQLYIISHDEFKHTRIPIVNRWPLWSRQCLLNVRQSKCKKFAVKCTSATTLYLSQAAGGWKASWQRPGPLFVIVVHELNRKHKTRLCHMPRILPIEPESRVATELFCVSF